MRAVLIEELGKLPKLGDAAEPSRGDGQTLLEVLAAGLNPVDVAVGSGKFFAGHPDLPYIAGGEVVGRVLESDTHEPGSIVYGGMEGLGIARDGGFAETAVVSDIGTAEIPKDADPAVAVGLGIAGLAGWVPLSWRAPVEPGDRVLVLGATGTVGLVAVQAARELGAERVVAAGRRPDGLERAKEAGADAVVKIDDVGDLSGAFKEAAGGDGPTYIFDPLWGAPLVAALEAAPNGSRVVNLGQSAGPIAEVPSGLVRGKSLDIFGYTNFSVPKDRLNQEYKSLVGAAASGRVRIDVERYPLDRAAEAWRRQVEGTDVKLVVTP